MGLWEYCFKDFRYPYYQFTTTFDGCHHIFSREYYVIREWLLPGWLMIVQTCVTLSFLLTFGALVVMSLELIRWPLKFVLQYEWVLTRASFYCISASCKYFHSSRLRCALQGLILVLAVLMFLAVAIFGGNAYRRDWLMYPRFNVLSWAYSVAVVSFMVLGMAALVLWMEARRAYDERREAKNLVQQMQDQEPGGYQSGFQTPAGRSIQGYI